MHTLLSSLGLLLLLIPSSADVGTLLSEGDDFYASFKNEQALAKYEQAFLSDSTSFETLIRMTRIYNDLGRINLHDENAAEPYYRKGLIYAAALVRRFPKSEFAQFWFALANGSMIPFSGVKEKIRLGHEVQLHAVEALRIDSVFSYPYVLLAVFEREASRLSWLERAIARIVFGEDISGSVQKAEMYLKKAVRCDPSNSAAYFELGRTYLEMGDREHAKEAFRCVVALKPQSLRDLVQQQETQRRLGRL
jgi:tetratricopeptide (TPR) repeat protein